MEDTMAYTLAATDEAFIARTQFCIEETRLIRAMMSTIKGDATMAKKPMTPRPDAQEPARLYTDHPQGDAPREHDMLCLVACELQAATDRVNSGDAPRPLRWPMTKEG
jgi:hypothetical protein